MRYLVPAIAWTGVSLAIYTGLLVPMIVQTLPSASQNEQLEKSMLCMVVLGVGEIVGGPFIGQVIDRFGNKHASLLSLLFLAISTCATLIFLALNTYGPLAFAMTFLWGLQDSIVNTHVSQILGFEYQPDTVLPFSVFNFVQCLTVFLLLLGEAALTPGLYIPFILVTGIAGLAMCGAVLGFPYKEREVATSGGGSSCVGKMERLEEETVTAEIE